MPINELSKCGEVEGGADKEDALFRRLAITPIQKEMMSTSQEQAESDSASS